jgi:hypothetical protein
MRRAAKIDGNQPAIVRDLRQCGASVVHMHTLGKGAPDIGVGWFGRNFLFEIKDPSKPKSDRQLTQDEAVFHSAWRGQVHVIETSKEALAIMDAAFKGKLY